MSEVHSAPSDTATAKSTNTRPGSCAARGRCNGPNTADNSAVSVLRSARSANNRDPACDTTPRPSAPTLILGRVAVAFTSKVPFCSVNLDYQQAQFPKPDRHFRSSSSGHAAKIVKSRG